MDPADTSPEARRVQYDAYRAMTGAERVLLAIALSEDAAAVARAGRVERSKEITG